VSDGLQILIASRTDAGEILCSPKKCSEITFLVSIGEIGERPPAGFANVARKLRLSFADSEDEQGPTERDVQQLLAFAGGIVSAPGTVLVHCQAGISRSSAAAYIIHAVALGPGQEEAALDRVYRERDIATPNRRMVTIADRLLGREGSLMRALQKRPVA